MKQAIWESYVSAKKLEKRLEAYKKYPNDLLESLWALVRKENRETESFDCWPV
jgi:hypothetical protein